MTRWQEFPLRPQGQPWPGLNTRGGLLDPGSGQLEDGSFNQVINEGDLLEKRKGFIRGLEERFEGPVCGLFKYTDDCGREYILVADEESIKIRTPFDIPTFLGADSFPNDDFEEDLSTERWRNTTDYETVSGALQLVASAIASQEATTPVGRHLNWFKDAAAPSYFVQANYDFDSTISTSDQVVSVVIKKNNTSSYLIGEMVFNPSTSTYQLNVRIIEGMSSSILIQQDIGGIGTPQGLLRLEFDASDRGVSVRVVPTGGTLFNETAFLTELQEAGLGQTSSLGITYVGATPPPATRILEVTGGTI